jgi:NADP-dependent 3-hydroxy acid dehydrogenase YdfG
MVMTGQRVVVVTGASAGVGRATARLFGTCGYRVAGATWLAARRHGGRSR